MKLGPLTDQVIALARETGSYIQDYQKKGFQTHSKSFNNLVTEVDLKAEQRLVDGLQKLFPEAGFIAEEGTGERKDEWNWIIDPIDGTTNFAHGIPIYSTSLALHHIERGVVLGVIQDIVPGDTYWSHQDISQAFKNKTSIQVSPKTELIDCLVATGFPYDNFEIRDFYMAFFNSLLGACRGVRRLGSAALDLAYVAEGRFDVFFEYGLNPWDVAAGVFIVQQAGGTVSGFKQPTFDLFGKEIVASNSQVHTEFMHCLSKI